MERNGQTDYKRHRRKLKNPNSARLDVSAVVYRLEQHMHPFCLEILRKNQSLLVSELQLHRTCVLNILLQDDVITQEQLEVILSKKTNIDRNETFLAIIRRCPPEHRPLKKLASALDHSHPFLSKAIRETAVDVRLRSKLSYLLKGTVCDRCTLLRYLDPKCVRQHLYRDGLIGEKLYELFCSYNDLPEMLQMEKILDTLLNTRMTLHMHSVWTSFSKCISNVLYQRSRNLAMRLQKMHSDKLELCRCTNSTDSYREIVCATENTCVLTLGADSHVPMNASSGNERHLQSLTKVAAELVRHLTFGEWTPFNTYVKFLRKTFPSDPNYESIITAHEMLSYYCQGRPEDALQMMPQFEESVKVSDCAMFNRLYFNAIKAGVYRATGRTQQADELVSGSLETAQSFSANKAVAFLYERHALNLLHKRNTDGNIVFPSEKVLERAAKSMLQAHSSYHKTARVVNDPAIWMLYEFEFWPLIEFVCIKLGTCIAGRFFHPRTIANHQWEEIEAAVNRIKVNFELVTPRRKVYFYLMYSDYHLRKAENVTLDYTHICQMLLKAREFATKAFDLAISSNLKSSFCDYAKSRLYVINLRCPTSDETAICIR